MSTDVLEADTAGPADTDGQAGPVGPASAWTVPWLMADPLRRRLVELLSAGPACTCHLVADTGAKQPTVSHHLRALREAGLVEAEPRGRFTYYRLVPEQLLAAADQLLGLAERARANNDRSKAC